MQNDAKWGRDIRMNPAFVLHCSNQRIDKAGLLIRRFF